MEVEHLRDADISLTAAAVAVAVAVAVGDVMSVPHSPYINSMRGLRKLTPLLYMRCSFACDWHACSSSIYFYENYFEETKQRLEDNAT